MQASARASGLGGLRVSAAAVGARPSSRSPGDIRPSFYAVPLLKYDASGCS